MKEKVLKIVSVIALAVFSVTLITTVILQSRPRRGELLDRGGEEQEAAIYLDGEAAEPGEVHSMPKSLAFRAASVSDSAVLRVTVLPESAKDKAVDFKAEFQNPDSDWARGKNVSDYFNYSQTSDGSTEVTVRCLNPFGEPILFTATSRNNPEATATCTVDYAQAVKGVKLGLLDGGSTTFFPLTDSVSTPGVYGALIDIGTETGGVGGVIGLTYQTDEVYTIPLGELTESVTFSGIGISVKSNASAGYTTYAMTDITEPLGKELRFNKSIFKNYAGSLFDVMSGQSRPWCSDSTDMKWIYDNIYGIEDHFRTLWNISVAITGEAFTYTGYSKIVWTSCDVSVNSLSFDQTQKTLSLPTANPFA